MTYASTINQIFSTVSSIIWGYIGDKFKFKYLFLGNLICYFLFGIVIGWNLSLELWVMLIVLMGSIDRGIFTIIGPGLVTIFGLDVGTKLYTIKSTSYFGAFMIIPLLVMVLSSWPLI